MNAKLGVLCHAGSGYLTGCLGVMVGDSGQVLGVEKHKELAQRSLQSLQQAVPELMKKDTIKIMPGNVLGKVLGQYGPFDAIHVGAAAATMPQVLSIAAVSANMLLESYCCEHWACLLDIRVCLLQCTNLQLG